MAESEAPGREELGSMIEEINETQVEAEEVLSDRAYYYDRESGNLRCKDLKREIKEKY